MTIWDELSELLDEDERRSALMWDAILLRQAQDAARYERHMQEYDAAHMDYRLYDEGDN